MKQLFMALLIAISTLSIYADSQPVGIDIRKKKTGTIGEGRERTSINIPVEVTFDNTTGVLTVSAPEDMEGYVYVYNVSGALEGTSQTLNVTFTLPKSGVHVIALEGETWTGEGKIIY
ncbi:MAG: hypothetical protein K2M56_10755 [Muribaculaceae bacterium]|nr:hypothetical protein [Muribaculaceae bacterium]